MLVATEEEKKLLHDIDFIVATKLPVEIINEFTEMPEVAQVISKGKTKSSVRLNNGLQCDLRAVKNSEFPFALNYFTGSKAHNVKMRSLLLKMATALTNTRLIQKLKPMKM